ncbi:pyridoxal phosphate-dependent aminotransferase [candidate division FCPU426 bacterium]|nr:pyridoxal phosphate-dependent aminotransferase [candidate division FCPU426 bacterium]
MQTARRMKRIAPSPTLAIDAKAKQLKAGGVDIINFGAGEPDFDTPDYIKNAAMEAIRAGYTKYTPASGSQELKEAVCDKLKRENGLDYSMKQIVINCGAKHSIYNIFQVMLNPGDEVIIPAPYWVTYPEAVKLAGGRPVVMKTTDKNEFKITAANLRRRIKPKTKMLIINSPGNPTGTVYSETELRDIMKVAVAKKIFVLSDEIYEHLTYDGMRHVSAAAVLPEAKDWTLVVNGVSKSFSMTGWRIGYTAGPEDIIADIGTLQSHSTSNPASISMKAAVAALTQPASVLPEMQRAFNERREYVVGRLNAMPGVVCQKPRGAFYVFPNVSGVLAKSLDGKVIGTSMRLAEYLLDTARVAVVPGDGFGADDYLRISYATSMANLQKGLERMEQALQAVN